MKKDAGVISSQWTHSKLLGFHKFRIDLQSQPVYLELPDVVIRSSSLIPMMLGEKLIIRGDGQSEMKAVHYCGNKPHFGVEDQIWYSLRLVPETITILTY